MDEEIIDRIYEAAAQPTLWPSVLDRLSLALGARGGTVVIADSKGSASFLSDSLIALFRKGVAGGHFEKMERTAPLFERMPPHFVTDTDLHSPERMRAMPVYRDLLIPEGMDAGTASAFQGAADDVVALSLEGFASHAAARAALPRLDALRPHLGRALSLSSRARLARDQAMVDGLNAIGTGAAIINDHGTLRAFNAAFEAALGNVATDRRSRLHFSHAGADARFAQAIAGLESGTGGGSVVVRPPLDALPLVMHVIPLRRTARDVFDAAGALLLLASGSNRIVPNGDLLRLLFDLTPREAELARALMQSDDLRSAAATIGTSYQTARVYLKYIFEKTGTNKQSSLLHLLSSYARPQGAAD